ncbi:CocE/NonD family hydrolase [Pseudomonas yamanorum]|uniref:CocE/NonD family hydrolase n=1 Tax=Pseudomonas yamanorum TaxID=515393 RepID=UPI001C466AC0|nr:CocE/NonD family hydrolase [Pseudomonas yamanorum]MBV6659719.1 CocE/NonD family hydrolase [Pseudomonas yamanorum]
MTFKTLDGQDIEIAYSKNNPLDTPESAVEPFHVRSVVLEPGYVHEPGRKPLTSSLIWDQDVSVLLRDGIVIYADVYRPVGDAPAPTVLVWTPYGKQGGWWKANVPLERIGIPHGSLSGLQNFESPDPAWWVARGYAVVMVDVRGSMHSGGDLLWWGESAANDVYDAVEWAAAQPWSNGRVGMSGNSQLSIMQWFGASAQPPHLAALAPWEGLIDMYRDNMAQGGIPTPEFQRDEVALRNYGLNRTENPATMIERYPLMNAYWADKRVKLERITLPVYAVASFSNTLHSRGTLTAFNGIASEHKWLRIHNTMEWPDLYQEDNVEDLCRFFDRYLKGEENGWEQTPRVRMSVLDPGGKDTVARPEEQWPPSAMQPQTFYLDGLHKTLAAMPTEKAIASYVIDSETDEVVFKMPIVQSMEIAGPIKLTLWVEAQGSEDMDLFAHVYKVDANGTKQVHITVPGEARQGIEQLIKAGKTPALLAFSGPQGRLRVSHRELDVTLSSHLEPVHSHLREQLLKPGDVVQVEIGIWPVAMKLHPGETLCVAVAGRPFDTFALPGMPSTQGTKTRNKGHHLIHTGGDRASHLVLPLMP